MLLTGLRTLSAFALTSTTSRRNVGIILRALCAVNTLDTIYKDRVAAVFDDKIRECDAKIATYTQNLTRIFHKCETRLKNLQKRGIYVTKV